MNNDILKSTKQTMINVITKLEVAQTTKDIVTVEEELQPYFDFLLKLVSLPQPLQHIMTLDAELLTKKEEESTSEEIEPANKKDIHVFERKAKGGMLKGTSIFVPERTVREKSIGHGDLIHVSKFQFPASYDGPTRYVYEVVEHKYLPDPKERVEFLYCVVKYDKTINSFVTDTDSTGKAIRINDVLQTIIIKDQDVAALRITDGDIVDIAYMEDKQSEIRVIWRYANGLKEVEETKMNKMLSTPKKRTGTKTAKPMSNELDGINILMLGLKPEEAEFKQEVARYGGNLIALSGKESVTQIENAINSSDVAIFMLSHVSHNATLTAADYCKQVGVPFDSIHGFGKSGFVTKAIKLVEEKKVFQYN